MDIKRFSDSSSESQERHLANKNGKVKEIENENFGHIELEKKVGLTSGIALTVGTMIGSGIFISPKGVTSGSGSVGLSLINWAICGMVAIIGSLTYCELGTMITESGAEYAYIKEGLGGILAYLFSWMSITVIKTSTVAICSLTCAEYIMVPLINNDCGPPPQTQIKLTACVLILLLCFINCYSVSFATRIQVFFTVAKILALIIIIVGGIVKMIQGHTHNLSSGFEGTESHPGKIAVGLYNGMWAYEGWNNLNYVTEEISNPYVNLPRALMIGIPLVTVLYLLVNISYFTVLSVADLLASPAVGITWADEVIPFVSWIIPVSVALSTLGAANGTLFSVARLNFVAAREGHMIEVLSMINVKRLTPMASLIFSTAISMMLVIPGDVGSLIDFFSFAIWLFYGCTALACIVMKFTTKYKDADRPYKVNVIFPLILLLASIFLVAVPIINDPHMGYLYVSLFILGGLIFYVPFVYLKKTLPCMGTVTTFFQQLLESSPAEDEGDFEAKKSGHEDIEQKVNHDKYDSPKGLAVAAKNSSYKSLTHTHSTQL